MMVQMASFYCSPSIHTPSTLPLRLLLADGRGVARRLPSSSPIRDEMSICDRARSCVASRCRCTSYKREKRNEHALVSSPSRNRHILCHGHDTTLPRIFLFFLTLASPYPLPVSEESSIPPRPVPPSDSLARFCVGCRSENDSGTAPPSSRKKSSSSATSGALSAVSISSSPLC